MKTTWNALLLPSLTIFLIALIVVRSTARGILGETSGISPAMLTDPLIAFALGMFTLTRLEMYVRHDASEVREHCRTRHR